MEEYGISGLAIVVSQNPRDTPTSYLASYKIDLGYDDPSSRKPIDENTIFRVDRLGQAVLGYSVFTEQTKPPLAARGASTPPKRDSTTAGV